MSEQTATFTIRAKGPSLQREFKGTMEVEGSNEGAASLLRVMLERILAQGMLTGDTSITAKLVCGQKGG